MELEVRVPSSFDFNFDNGRVSPYISPPSTPKRFGNFFLSAPSSPARIFGVYGEMDDFSPTGYDRGEASSPASPAHWDDRLWPLERARVDGSAVAPNNASASPRSGKKNSMKPPPHGGKVDKMMTVQSPLMSPRTPKSQRKKSVWNAFSPIRKKESNRSEIAQDTEGRTAQGRGRERASIGSSTSKSRRQATRSTSPPRVSKYIWEEDEEEEQRPQSPKGPEQSSDDVQQVPSTHKPPSSALSLSTSSRGSRKWRLKDFFLFRSASEGRASEKDPFKKYADLYKKHQVTKSSKSREGAPTMSPRRGPVSAHELHYNVNKEISQDMRKKSFLPYKQGILGRLAVNPTVHALAYGIGSQPQTYN